MVFWQLKERSERDPPEISFTTGTTLIYFRIRLRYAFVVVFWQLKERSERDPPEISFTTGTTLSN